MKHQIDLAAGNDTSVVVTTKYSLRHKVDGFLMGVDTSDDYRLCPYSLDIWGVDTPEQAIYVLQFSTPWYNADYSHPLHSLAVEDYIVVRRVVTVSETKEDVYIPTDQDLTDFIRDEYSRPAYGNDGYAVEGMVKMYVTHKSSSMHKVMYNRFLSWRKEKEL